MNCNGSQLSVPNAVQNGQEFAISPWAFEGQKGQVNSVRTRIGEMTEVMI